MTVALVHLLTAPAAELAPAWSAQFRSIPSGDPDDPGPVQAYGPPLPERLRGITLAIGEQTSTGIGLFDSFADAEQAEPDLRMFWSSLTGREVTAGIAAGCWQQLDGAHQPARMIWVGPTTAH